MHQLFKVVVTYDNVNQPAETELVLADSIETVQSATQPDRYCGEWLLQSETAEKVIYKNRSPWSDNNRVLMKIEAVKFKDLTD